MPQQIFTKVLNEEVKRQNISNDQLYKLLGTNKIFVERLLNGEVDLTLNNMIHIANVLNCKLKITLEECNGIK